MSYDWDEDVDWSGNDVDPMIFSAVGDRLWAESAACKGVDPEIFFIERGYSTRPAKLICYSCPVQDICLDYVMGLPGATVGVWGGLSEKERKRLKKMEEQGLG